MDIQNQLDLVGPGSFDGLYFAYGSNLNLAELKQKCLASGVDPKAIEPVGPAILPDMSLVFNYHSVSRGGGALNVRPAIGNRVSGYVLRLSQKAWALMDRKEGHPTYYKRTSVTLIVPGGQYLLAETYIVAPDRTRDFVAPTKDYLDLCLEGRDQLGVETASLNAASKDASKGPLHALFSYGTLRRGESRFDAIARYGLRCALLAQTRGCLVNFGAYPGLRPSPDHDVQGEFFISKSIASVLPKLDRIEGFNGFDKTDNLFSRTIIDVHVGEGRVRQAWAYLANNDHSVAPSPSHDWRADLGRAERAKLALIDCHAAHRPNFYEILASNHNRNERQFSNPPTGEIPVIDRAILLAALNSGEISERKMAQASGLWTASIPDQH
jgi:gamma-glutamylcyclotransferase (GGCT)/AIG2-like uncharacterized protein YtfP